MLAPASLSLRTIGKANRFYRTRSQVDRRLKESRLKTDHIIAPTQKLAVDLICVAPEQLNTGLRRGRGPSRIRARIRSRRLRLTSAWLERTPHRADDEPNQDQLQRIQFRPSLQRS